jgi:AcrR family transcriptional regulator
MDPAESTSPPATDPRIERTRARVVEAALELLREDGPEAVTHQKVAERASVGRATIYRHWPDRWSLIIAAFENLSMSMNASTDLPVRDSLIAVLEQLCDHFASPMSVAMASLISRAEWEPEARAFLNRLIDHAGDEIGNLLDRGVAEEGLELDVPPETALATIAGPFFYERFIGGGVVSREQIPAHIDALIARWTPAS